MIIEIMMVSAAVLAASTLFFPVQGKAGIVMRGIGGIFFVIASGLLAGVIVMKLSELGWSSRTIILLAVLMILALGKGVLDLIRVLADMISKRKEKAVLQNCFLYQGRMLHKSGGVYYLKGNDYQGKSRRFRISHGTFTDLTEKNLSRYMADVHLYPYTKIVADIKLIRR